VLTAFLAVGFASPAASQVLQVELLASLPTDRRATTRFESVIEPGLATLSGVARNRKGGSVQVDLVLLYQIPRDTIALDEVIERIEVATETSEGEPFIAATIDTGLIPLNPNRAPLRYRVTLYHPEEGDPYRLRIRLFGNYE
jgi:hypothetical protein